jgi:hypothetical protein
MMTLSEEQPAQGRYPWLLIMDARVKPAHGAECVAA